MSYDPTTRRRLSQALATDIKTDDAADFALAQWNEAWEHLGKPIRFLRDNGSWAVQASNGMTYRSAAAKYDAWNDFARLMNTIMEPAPV